MAEPLGLTLLNASIWLLAIFQIWLAHAVVYLMHEYAHSLLAWIFHFKANPLALDYGHFDLANILFQEDIDENVDYGPIFAAGRGYVAAIIAVAGVLIGNGISYVGSRLLYSRAMCKKQRAWAMFFFWALVMSVGNFLSYVPMRTFTTHADMATVARGAGVSSWLICLILGIPFAVAVWHFFAKVLPGAEEFLFRDEPALQGALILIATCIVFVFFGGSGLYRYGDASHILSAISEYVLFPLVTILLWQRQKHLEGDCTTDRIEQGTFRHGGTV